MELTWANRITIMRILLIPPFIIFMLKASDPEMGIVMRYFAIAIFLVMCVSDVLDGYVARVKKQVTRLGAFLDPLADKLLMLCACVILAGQTTSVENYRLPLTVVVLIIGKDVFLALGFLTVFMMVAPEVHVKPALSGKAATFLQLSMVLSILIAPEMETLWFGWYYFVRVLWWIATVVATITVMVYIRNGALYVQQHES